jgi:hypothetical protein
MGLSAIELARARISLAGLGWRWFPVFRFDPLAPMRRWTGRIIVLVLEEIGWAVCRMSVFLRATVVGTIVCLATFFLCAVGNLDEAVAARTSDPAYVKVLYDHLVRNGDFRDFSLSNSPYFFPDLLVHAGLVSIYDDSGFAFIGYSAVLIGLVFAFIIPWLKPSESQGRPVDSVLLVLAVAFAVLSYRAFTMQRLIPVHPHAESLYFFFLPAFHAGAAAAGIGVLCLVRYLAFFESPRFAIGLTVAFVIIVSSVASDTIIVPWFLAPVCAALVLGLRSKERRWRGLLIVSQIAFAVLCGWMLNQSFTSRAIPLAAGLSLDLSIDGFLQQITRIGGYYVAATMDAPLTIPLFLGGWGFALMLLGSKSKESRFLAAVFVFSSLASHAALLVVPIDVSGRCFIGPDTLAIVVMTVGGHQLLVDHTDRYRRVAIGSLITMVSCFTLSLIFVSRLEPDPEVEANRKSFHRMVEWIGERQLTRGVASMADAKRVSYVSNGYSMGVPIFNFQPTCPAAALTRAEDPTPEFVALKNVDEERSQPDRIEKRQLVDYFGEPQHVADFGRFSVLDYRGNEIFASVFESKILRDAGQSIELHPIQLPWPDVTTGRLDAQRKVLSVSGKEGERNHLALFYHLWLNDGRYRVVVDKTHTSGELSVQIVAILGSRGVLVTEQDLSADETDFEFELDVPSFNATRLSLSVFSKGDLSAEIRMITIRKTL